MVLLISLLFLFISLCSYPTQLIFCTQTDHYSRVEVGLRTVIESFQSPIVDDYYAIISTLRDNAHKTFTPIQKRLSMSLS